MVMRVVKVTGLVLITLVLKVRDNVLADDEVADFVVIGAGSAGAPLTNRISAEKKFKVILLRKGGRHTDPVSRVPAFAQSMVFTQNADIYYVEPQENFGMSLIDNRQVWIKGKGIGGTSLVNYLVATWAHKGDFDRWAAAGNPSWSYDKVVPLFKSNEDYHNRRPKDTLRGTRGDLDVTKNQIFYKGGKAFIEGCQQSGIKYLDDYNAGGMFGVGAYWK